MNIYVHHLWADDVTINIFKNIRFDVIRDMLMGPHVFYYRFTGEFIKNIHTPPFYIYWKVPTLERSVSLVIYSAAQPHFQIEFSIFLIEICVE